MYDGKMIFLIVEILIALAVLYVVQIPLRRSRLKVLRIFVFLLKAVMILGSALLFVAIEWPMAYTHGDILIAIYVALVCDVAASIIEFVVRHLRRKKDGESEKPAFLFGFGAVLSLILCILFVGYGVWNAWNIDRDTDVWEAEGLKEEHTFAFAADLHTGTAQSMERLEGLCEKINEASPEFVVFGGDVTDELTSHDEMIETYQILSKIEAPVYFIYGNHDRQPGCGYLDGETYTDEELAAAIEGAGIKILSDEYVKVADDLILLGREDITMKEQRKPWSQLVNPYEGEGALVVVDHQPYDEEQVAVEKSALQLSGHTHAGQIWPLQLFYTKALGLPAYGEFQMPGTRLYVTAGANDWMIPLRTEEHCEWELITLKPVEQE